MRVLFFGLGGIGQRHLRILKKLYPNVKIGAVRVKDRQFEIGDDLQPDYGTDILLKYDISTYASLETALTFKPDFAIVANPTNLHVSTAKELLNNEVPVFLEKPISHSLEGIDKLLKLSKGRNILVAVGYMMRFHPCSLKLKDLIENKRIGRIYSINLNINSYMPGWHRYEKCNEFYAGLKSLGGGVVLTEIHELDLLTWYFGAPEKLWAVGGKLSNLDIDVEDTVGILMEQKFDGDSFPVNVTMSFVQPAPYRKMVILGEKGKIEWDITLSEINVEDKTNNSQEVFKNPGFQRNEMFVDQLNHFIKCLKERTEPITSLANVIDGHLVSLTIKDVLENGTISSIVTLQ
jgi:predicted dehydrogenase